MADEESPMPAHRPDQGSQSHYRVDKFKVPANGRDEFLDRVFKTQAFLEQQEGFVQGLVLEQQSGPGVFNVVTLVEWSGPEVVERVTAAVARFHQEMGFDRQELIARLGITADIAGYRRIDA
jgi:hypothetical protein